MAEEKRYFWLKLNENFFEQEEIKIIEGMENGEKYVNFYLKLLLKSLSADGKLLFRNVIPYTPEMLATITNTNIDTVRIATKLFVSLGLMEKLDDGSLFMNEVENMVGSETGWAKKKRIQRGKKDNVPKLSEKCPTEIELEIELDKDIDNKESIEKTDDKSSCPYSDIQNLYSSICKSFPKLTKLSDARKKAIKARLNSGYTVDDFKKLFEMSEGSTFLKGKNKRNWRATFDWLIKDANMAKVLDGNYADKKPQEETQSATYDISEYEDNPVFGSFER